MLAASTAFVRIEMMLALTAPELAFRIAPALAAMLVPGLALGFGRHRPETEQPERHKFENPPWWAPQRCCSCTTSADPALSLVLAFQMP